MKTTGNLGLKKPEGTDIVDINDLNGNMDILDTAIKAAQDHAGDTAKHITTAERTAWNAKASTAVATTAAAGLMDAADKVKLDTVAAGANKYVHPNHTGDVISTGDGVTAIAPGVIVNADIHAAAAIDPSKIGAGTVSTTEFGYLDGVTGNIQTQLNSKAPLIPQTTASINYYVRTDGNDNNNGLENSVSGAFKTVQKAISMIPKIVNHAVFVTISAGIYPEDVELMDFSGAGYVRLETEEGASLRSARVIRVADCDLARLTFTDVSKSAAIYISDGGHTLVSGCSITEKALGKDGISVYGQRATLNSCTISNRENAVYMSKSALVNMTNCSGTGNIRSAFVRDNSVVSDRDSAISGYYQGGYGGVVNPWGDSTTVQRSSVARTHAYAQSLSASTATKINYEKVVYDHLEESDGTGTITVKARGIYNLEAAVSIRTVAQPGVIYHMFIYVNGSSVLGYRTSGQNIQNQSVVNNFVMKLNAGDVVSIYFLSSIAVTTNADPALSYLQMTRIA